MTTPEALIGSTTPIPANETNTDPVLTSEALERLAETQPMRARPRRDSPQTLAQLAETQPIRTMHESETSPEELAKRSLVFLDKLAIRLTTVNGKQINYLNQTFLDFLGIPTVLSAGDVVGFLKGYLNVRQGNIVRGAAEIITAVVTGIPTGPAHKLIDMIDNFLEQKSK